MQLGTAVYSATHGYAWSSVPEGLDEVTLDRLLELATRGRPEFPSPDEVIAGMVSDGKVAGVFTLRNVPGWDAAGRSSDYAAFALLPASEAAKVDVGTLLWNEYFGVATREVPREIGYAGPSAAAAPLDAPGRLLCQSRYDGLAPSAAGTILAAYHAQTDEWRFIMNPETGMMDVECGIWERRLKK